jgi:hypothetical protein
MKKKTTPQKLTAAIALAGLTLAAFWLGMPSPEQEARPSAPPTPPPAAEADSPPPSPPATPEAPASEPAPPPAPDTTPPAISPEDAQRVLDAIDNLEFAFRDHAAALGGNPVGTNAEITAALRGDNARQLVLDIPSGSTLSPDGELLDPWGTPWFFHQLSGTKMEIRSAGPDRILHTEDDFLR